MTATALDTHDDHRSRIERIYDTYVATFATKDPAAIVQNHAPDGVFWLRNGGDPVTGRDAIAHTFGGFFANWPEFGFEVERVILTESNWILDWAITAVLTDRQGAKHPVRIAALDVLDIDEAGLVARKDTWLDGAQLRAAYAKIA